jgi:hypothetical protein
VAKHPRQVPPPPIPQTEPDLPLSEHGKDQLRGLQAELSLRQMEALRLYRAQPKQDEFHACLASERLIVGGVRSGKSVATAAEIARAATCQDPHGKYPTTPMTICCFRETRTASILPNPPSRSFPIGS